MVSELTLAAFYIFDLCNLMKEDPDVIEDFYVYLHRDPVSGVPFYVGKGRGQRAYDKKRRHPDWRSHVERLGGRYEVEFIAKGLRESDAFLIEAEWIAKFGKKADGSGTLVNWTDGGENELGNIGIKIEIPGLAEKYDATTYRQLRSDERKEFGATLSKVLDGFVMSLFDYYRVIPKGLEYSRLECIIASFEDDVHQFCSRRCSCKDIAFALDDVIGSLEWVLECGEISNPKAKDAVLHILPQLKASRERIS